MDPERSTRPRRIGQFVVSVGDVDRANYFYRDVLGHEHLVSAPPGFRFSSVARCGSCSRGLKAWRAGPHPRGIGSG